ncbi:MAG: hypothetical protein PHX60_07290 [Giesbergeria sp.]|uniref:hypothetical protein n=1 Tax=Giesbergeria sp. TaxID=2818473 RepID=UPI002634F45F|nr:hypothetical protein [Giesbergeria sp.]MDD2609491.1 hypothetical protein [Giesbergeria sp.]
MEYYEIGPSPWGEECAQIGEDGYNARARAECRAFIGQILRHYPALNARSKKGGRAENYKI